MGQETAKAVARRLHDTRFVSRYFRGFGIDIGSGSDPLHHYQTLFPGILGVASWDKEQGDAQTMGGVADNIYDFVHSSHCLEHLEYPSEALKNWIRICKPGGHVIVVVPDWQLYEHGKWPSPHNEDHKRRFSVNGFSPPVGAETQPQYLISVTGLASSFVDRAEFLKIELLDQGYLYGAPDTFDQSSLTMCEPAIEFILRKR
jgi:SAM-dependent methyltransferase